MLSIGIDFGTSNSSVAAFDGTSIRLLPLDTDARDPQVMRSLLYITRAGDIVTGQRALDLYTEQNTGREVKLERRYIGEVKMVFSDMTVVKDAYALVDVNEPGRLFQSLKRFLPITSFQKTNVFGTEYKIEELVATLATSMVRAGEATLGQKIDQLVVGRPVRFSDDTTKNEAARTRLEAAWRLTGVAHVRFVEEPIGAAHHYAAEAQLPAGARFLVFDFGGGTLDITIARATNDGIEVLSTGGVALGGDLIDSRIMETRVAKHFGTHARYQPDGLPMPNHVLSRLKSWQTVVELNRPDLLDIIRDARRKSDQPRELANLEGLVTRNLGLATFRALEEAKIALSSEERGDFRMSRYPLDITEPITRPEFEAAISVQLRDARDVVLRALEDAACHPDEISVVITTGGSSLIPAFRQMLEETLPRAEIAATGTFTSVASGLALAGFNQPWEGL